MTPQMPGGIANENTIIFHKTQNKSLWEGQGTFSNMGTNMNSFGMQSATSTWIKQEKKENSPKHSTKGGDKKLKIDYLKHLKLESKVIKHRKKKDKISDQI